MGKLKNGLWLGWDNKRERISLLVRKKQTYWSSQMRHWWQWRQQWLMMFIHLTKKEWFWEKRKMKREWQHRRVGWSDLRAECGLQRSTSTAFFLFLCPNVLDEYSMWGSLQHQKFLAAWRIIFLGFEEKYTLFDWYEKFSVISRKISTLIICTLSDGS